MQNKKRREELFLLLCLAAAGVCAVLAFRFAVPLQAQTPQTLPDTKELAAYTQVELNTADADALCTLPGVGPHNAHKSKQNSHFNGHHREDSSIPIGNR